MLDGYWKQFKSGTDVRGVAMEGAGEPVNLSDEAIERIAAGFAEWLSQQTGRPCEKLTIAVGRDSRLSGSRIAAAVIRALTGQGTRVLDGGLASTPAMFMTTIYANCDGAVQVTASHHPWYRNGLKFFTRDGGLDEAALLAVLQKAQDGVEPAAVPGSCGPADFLTPYAAGLRRLLTEKTGEERPLEGLHIVVDAGNGVGGFYAAEVLAPLGARIDGSQFLEPDGRFPHHIPNPEDPQAMAAICAAVRENGADFGVIFDTDVDRAGCVDSRGQEMGRNRLVALTAALALRDTPGGVIVTDSVTSDGLKDFIEACGGAHRRYKRGYKNVIDEARRLQAAGIPAPLAMETSGHAAFADNYYLDDGAYLVTRLLAEMVRMRRKGRRLEDRIASLRQPKDSVELRFPITQSNFREYGECLLAAFEAFARETGFRIAPDSAEGVRIAPKGPRGFVMLRLSVHDPVMALNAESDEEGGCRALLQKVSGFLAAQDGLDSRSLRAYTAAQEL